jgi:hypothetical protein
MRTSPTTAVTVAIAVVIGLAACDLGRAPSIEDQMHSLGLPLDILMTVDEATQVTVRSKDGVPELLIFVTQTLGSSRPGINPAKRPTVNGGMVGDAISPGPHIEGKLGPAHLYLFGAGQGPITRVEVDEPVARAELVNPDVDGWVIVMPETVGVGTLGWSLIGPDGQPVFESVGIGLPDFGMKVDQQTRAWVRFSRQVPELLVYTTNAFGGADLAVTVADHPTANGGLAGSATSPGYRYLFGAGQGPLRPGQGVRVREPSTGDPSVTEAHAQSFDYPTDAGWVIAVPDTIAIEDIEWSLVGPDGTTLYQGIGLERRQP